MKVLGVVGGAKHDGNTVKLVEEVLRAHELTHVFGTLEHIGILVH